MSRSLSDYFALEAGDYLEQLDHALGEGAAPDPDRLVSLARGIRGSAQLAEVEGVARIAERLMGAAGAVMEGRITWNEDLRARAIRTVDDLKVLVRAPRPWGAPEEARVGAALARWADFETARPSGAGEGAPREDRVLPFLRSEIAGIISQLNLALPELRRDPAAGESTRDILRRMRTIRGMGAGQALAPVFSLLEGLEALLHEVATATSPLEGPRLDLLLAGRDALIVVAGSLERSDVPAAGDPELQRFQELRERLNAGGAEGVVSVVDLFFHDEEPNLVSSPVAPIPSRDNRDEVLRYVGMEATGTLDRAGEVATHAEGGDASRALPRLEDLAQRVRSLAVTYRFADLVKAAESAAARIRSAASTAEARTALDQLRSALPGAVAPPVGGAAVADEAGIVSIDSLQFRGAAALREALSLRPEVEERARVEEQPELRELFSELFDLVRLGLDEANPT